MVMAEMKKPRDTFVLERGDYRNQGEKVAPGVPAMLPPLPADAPLNRLTLAKLARATRPSADVSRRRQSILADVLRHRPREDARKTSACRASRRRIPELLDWLATEFVRTGWDVRAMQRLIVTSATYRQSSAITPALLEKDPENRLLARGPRVRLPAEMIRDTALSASGLLNDRIGGPSVLPYQPTGLWEEMAFGDGFSAQAYEQSHGADLYRRGMYTLLEAHGAARVAGDVRRARSREVHGPAGDDEHAAAGPGAAERSDVRRGRARAGAAHDARGRQGREEPHRLRVPPRNRARADGQGDRRPAESVQGATWTPSGRIGRAALKLLSVGESPRDKQLDVAELAAWTTVTSVIFNLDETLTKQ